MGRLSEGDRVAHVGLDESLGGARAGVVEQVLEESEPRLVIARYEDNGESEGFIESELVSLGPAKRSRGPVILSSRHLRRVLSQRLTVLGIMLCLTVALSINVISRLYEWSLLTVGLVSAGALLCALLVFSMIDEELDRRRGLRE